MSIGAFLSQTARWATDRPAVSKDGQDLLTYGELAARVRRVAGGLETYGLRSGDRLAILMENNEHYLEVLLAAWHAGLVAVPVNARLHEREVAYILEDSAAGACVTSDRLESTARAASGATPVVVVGTPAYQELIEGPEREPAMVDPDDPAWLFYTSGTTGRPKGATLTHRNLTAAVLSMLADAGPFEPGGAVLHLAPLSHAGGLFALALTARAYRHVIPTSTSFDLDEVCELLHHYPRACLFGVPTMLVRLLDHPRFDAQAVDHVERVFYGGAPMYVEDLKRLVDCVGGDRLWQAYGQGEAPATITHLPGWLHHGEALASVGIARTGVQVAVVDEAGRELPPGEVGEVVVRGDVVMQGYWNNPDATAAAIRDGWLHTGDLGAMDERGFLTLKDRSKDVVISGGSNIYPREVEEVLLAHPDVTAVAVIGRPDPEWGEAVVAFVVAGAGSAVTAAELDAFCQQHMARYKRPRDYVFVDALPTSTVGKILKTELRDLFATTH